MSDEKRIDYVLSYIREMMLRAERWTYNFKSITVELHRGSPFREFGPTGDFDIILRLRRVHGDASNPEADAPRQLPPAPALLSTLEDQK